MFNSKNKKGKKAQALISTIAMSTFILASAPSPAFAGGNGGTGGGGQNGGGCINGCSLQGPWYWRYTSTGGGQTAWQKFAGQTNTQTGAGGIPKMTLENTVRTKIPAIGMTNSELLSLCQTSKIVWWVSAGNPYQRGYDNAWGWNFQGKTYPSTEGSNRPFTGAQSAKGSSMDSNIQQMAIKWANNTGSNKISLICSNMFTEGTMTSVPITPSATPSNSSNPNTPDNSVTPNNSTTPTTPADSGGGNTTIPQKPETITETWNESRKNPPTVVEKNWTHPYSYVTTITRQISKNDTDPIGKNNLHDQKATYTKTSFGALWDDMSMNKDKYRSYTPAQIKELVNKAVAIDKKTNHNTTDMDDQNKAGMAEGGILNVNELTKSATISAKQTTESQSNRSCTKTTDWSWSPALLQWVQNTPETNCGDWDTQNSAPTFEQSTIEDATLKQTGFWQMLSVHCNKDEFDKLKKELRGATIVNTNDASGKFSAVIYTKKYTSQPATLDVGDPNSTNQILKRTSDLGFYDKLCPFDCTSDITGKGASSANTAISNINNRKPAGGTVSSSYGALANKNNSNTFTFFRDNIQHVINTDVWYPTANGVVNYKGEAPLTTTVNRWGEGTPGLTDSNGGKFTMKNHSGNEIFTANSLSNGNTLKDWDDQIAEAEDNSVIYSTDTTAIIKGLERNFTVQATWASDPNKEQRFNFSWRYAPQVSTTFNTKNIGFDSKDKAMGEQSVESSSIDGICYAVFGQKQSYDTTELLQNNSGSGTNDTQLNTTNDKNNNTNLFVNFIRSTTE